MGALEFFCKWYKPKNFRTCFRGKKAPPHRENDSQKENQGPPRGEKGPSYGEKGPHPKNEKKAPQIDFSKWSERLLLPPSPCGRP